MSGKAFGWARDLRGWSGGPMAKAVLLLMADYADGRSGELYPSVASMAEELGQAERTVQRAITSLLADGVLERELRSTDRGKTTSSRYRIIMRVDIPRFYEAPEGFEGLWLWVSRDELARLHPRHSVTPTPVTVSPSPPSQCHHHMNLYPEPESADALSAGARDGEAGQGDQDDPGEAVDAGRAEFDQLVAAWAAKAPERVAPGPALDAWTAVGGATRGEALLRAGLRYLDEAGEVKRGFVRPLERWLKDLRFEPWLLAPEGPAPATAMATEGPWAPLPEGLKAAFAEMFTPAQIASYQPVGWRAEGRVAIARSGSARDWLLNQGRAWLKANELQVITAAEASAGRAA